MAHIKTPEGAPGIIGLMQARPDTAAPLNALADALLNTNEGLSRGERELIAAYVSRGNACNFCYSSHRAFSEALLPQPETAAQVFAGLEAPDISGLAPKMQALLRIADKVRADGKTVTEADVQAAREAGADDFVIHDVVLIAAAFCMFNRYVDGLGTQSPPTEHESYKEMAQMIAANGYGGSV